MLQYCLVLFKKALAVKKHLPRLIKHGASKEKKRHNLTKLQQNRVNNNAPSHRKASDIPKQLSVAIQSEP